MKSLIVSHYLSSETISLYSKLLVDMDQTGKRLLFDAYGLDKRHCDSLFESTSYMLRCFNYLIPGDDEIDFGLHAHTDYSYFTILHQNNVKALQVKLRNRGEWIYVDPSPCKFLFVAGEALKVSYLLSSYLLSLIKLIF